MNELQMFSLQKFPYSSCAIFDFPRFSISIPTALSRLAQPYHTYVEREWFYGEIKIGRNEIGN